MRKYKFREGHPHAGEFCKPNENESNRTIGGVIMYPWWIIDCKHEEIGTPEWTYAEMDMIVVCFEELNAATDAG